MTIRTNYDQYGSRVPSDLVVLSEHNPEDFDAETLRLIMKADWYEAAGEVILVSASDIRYAFDDEPEDAGIDLSIADIFRIAEPLKRSSEEDGFYHA